MDQTRVSANSNTEEVQGRANQNYRTWLSPQAFVWKKPFSAAKLLLPPEIQFRGYSPALASANDARERLPAV
jgi:hypothetical protein